MRRRAMLAGLLALGAAPVAHASGAYGKYLPPDQAFRLRASATANVVTLAWRIALNYYLYRDKFTIRARNGALGAPRFPKGAIEDDPTFGRVEVYRGEVRVRVPLIRAPAHGTLALVVGYQGCVIDGICYPPITRNLTVAV